jgi:hypothetical protein
MAALVPAVSNSVVFTPCCEYSYVYRHPILWTPFPLGVFLYSEHLFVFPLIHVYLAPHAFIVIFYFARFSVFNV